MQKRDRQQQRATAKKLSGPEMTRKLHLNIPEEIHQRLRVKCALEDYSMQDYVSDLITEAVKDLVLPSSKPVAKERDRVKSQRWIDDRQG